jgi:type IV pilus assembly protein PilP
MYKIICCVICVLFLVTFSGLDQSEAFAKPVKYVSNRIKIKRPEMAKADKVPPGQVATAEPEKIPVESQVKKASVPAAEPDLLASKQADAGPSFDMDSFLGGKKKLYRPKGRIDPFAPFIHKPEEQTSVMKETITRRIPMTPIEKMALSQLKLTGVLRMPDKLCALVEEVSGKGYIINEGTYIGNKGGQVKKILKDRVVVEEKYLDVYGKIAVRESELKLQK